jgi:hypothetical protein
MSCGLHFQLRQVIDFHKQVVVIITNWFGNDSIFLDQIRQFVRDIF